jgi:Concanavalin A-like lectin/glucanases superfamily
LHLSERSVREKQRQQNAKITNLEKKEVVQGNAATGGNIIDIHQGYSAVQCRTKGEMRKAAIGSGTTIAEDTDPDVVAHARFDDLGGSNVPFTSPFDATNLSLPIKDDKGLSGLHLQGRPQFFKWSEDHPVTTNQHLKTFVNSKSLSLNVPGTDPDDRYAFIYYASIADFNLATQISMQLWFKPYRIDIPGGFRTLIYRYQDASNWYFIGLSDTDMKVYSFVKEAGVDVKVRNATPAVLGEWNLLVFRYDTGSDVLDPIVNNNATLEANTTVLTAPYTLGNYLFVGGLPQSEEFHYSGLIDNFTFWKNELLSSTEYSNLFNWGTIVST